MRTIKACEVMLSLIILFLFQWAVEAKDREPSLLGSRPAKQSTGIAKRLNSPSALECSPDGFGSLMPHQEFGMAKVP